MFFILLFDFSLKKFTAFEKLLSLSSDAVSTFTMFLFESLLSLNSQPKVPMSNLSVKALLTRFFKS